MRTLMAFLTVTLLCLAGCSASNGSAAHITEKAIVEFLAAKPQNERAVAVHITDVLPVSETAEVVFANFMFALDSDVLGRVRAYSGRFLVTKEANKGWTVVDWKMIHDSGPLSTP